MLEVHAILQRQRCNENITKKTGTLSDAYTDTNPLTDYIHNTKHRMPAILSKEDEEKWLSPSLTKEDLESLLQPFNADKMDAYQIENNFIKKAPNDSSILQRAQE